MKKDINNQLYISNPKKIVSVAIIIAITGLIVFSSALVNPLWAKSSKHEDKTTTSSNSGDKKGNSTAAAITTPATGATATPTLSSASEQSDYKNFQKCLSTAAGKQGFATKTDIQNCFKPIYSTTTSSTGTNSSALP